MNNDPNDAKASFDTLYTSPDPRDYFSILGSLDYAIPELAKPVFRRAASAFRKAKGRDATILDLGSSYGINAALFRYPIDVSTLRSRYARPEMMNLPSDEVRSLDKSFFSSWPRVRPERLIAVDISQQAVDYALSVGLVDDGVAADLEGGAADEITRRFRDVDIIISTGVVGYVSEKTFHTLLQANGGAPWVISFCLRMFDYTPIAEQLSAFGLVTEKLSSAAFVQRRFQDEEEAGQVLDVLRERGIDPDGLESDGLLMAELFISRPPEDVEALPIDQLVRVVSGRNLSFGPRLVQVKRGTQKLLAPLRP